MVERRDSKARRTAQGRRDAARGRRAERNPLPPDAARRRWYPVGATLGRMPAAQHRHRHRHGTQLEVLRAHRSAHAIKRPPLASATGESCRIQAPASCPTWFAPAKTARPTHRHTHNRHTLISGDAQLPTQQQRHESSSTAAAAAAHNVAHAVVVLGIEQVGAPQAGARHPLGTPQVEAHG